MDADELYGLPLDRFVAERGALAKALRADGKREDAAAVAGLRKPSVAAWAVNQLVRTQGGAVDELFGAGDALRQSQADLLAGQGDGRALRAAGERERAAVDALVQSARGLLSSEGHELSPAIVERVGDTLHAAALDEDAREQVRHGRLERELRHVGLGLGESPFLAAAPSPSPPKAKGKAKGPDAEEERHRAEAERAEAERVERERAAAREAAHAAETSARRRTERAARALKAAEERRERAAAALDEADEALADAREEAEQAADAHRLAHAELERT